MLESLLIKVARLKACDFIKTRLQHRCFPVNIAKLLRAPFFTGHLRWLLLWFVKWFTGFCALPTLFLNGLTHSALECFVLLPLKKTKQKKKTALNDHISKTWKDLESRLKFLESSSNYLQNSVLFGALYSRCQRLQGLLMSQKKIFKLLLFFPYFFEKWAESLKKNIFFYIWPKAMP